MSKKSYFQRTKSIVKRLNTKPYATFEEISEFIQKEFDYLGDFNEEETGFSKRTFQRDIKEIYDVWGIQIAFCKRNKGYHIVKDTHAAHQGQRLFEVYEMMNALQIAEDLTGIMYFEKRIPMNTHYFNDIIYAIKKKVYLRIDYQKFGDEQPAEVTIAPYALKEFGHRWYIVAKIRNERLRIYALDRILDIKKMSERFVFDKSLDIAELYKDNFGIYANETKTADIVELAVDASFAPYVKSLPLHTSQEVVTETLTTCVISLRLKISDEFVNEILSYGSKIKVLKPKSLQKLVISNLQAGLKQYDKG